MFRILIILAIFGISFISQAKTCEFEGARLIDRDGNSRNFSNFIDVMKAAIPGNKILIGSALEQAKLFIDGKTDLTVSSDCDAEISQIVIRKSNAIGINSLKVKVEEGNAIQLAGDDLANSNVILSGLALEPRHYRNSHSGVVVGAGSSDIRILDSTILGFPNSGIILNNQSRSILIANTKSHDNFRLGLIIKDDVEVEIQRSEFLGNGRENLIKKVSGFGIAFSRSDLNRTKTIESRIEYNFGCLERSSHCDISNFGYITWSCPRQNIHISQLI